MSTSPVRKIRAPLGVVTDRPVLMRLLPDERERIERHAAASNCSLSAFARRMTLAGITQFEGKNPADCMGFVRRPS